MSMRGEAEIEKMFDALGNDEDEAPIHWKGDNFRYGLFIGNDSVGVGSWIRVNRADECQSDV